MKRVGKRRAWMACCLAMIALSVFPVDAALVQFKLAPVGLQAGDDFGCSVAVDGLYAAVGACRAGLSNRGRVDIYHLDIFGGWELDQTINAPFVETAEFGRSVALSGTTLAIGVPGRTVNGLPQAGRVYVYVRSATSWNQEDTVTADVPQNGGHFGSSVTLEGNQLVVGAPDQNPADADNLVDEGAAYVFRRTAGTWSLNASLDPSDASLHDFSRFGWSVALSGNRAVIGAPGDADGSALLFRRVNNVWGFEREFLVIAADEFGTSVALLEEDADTALVLVGDPTTDGASGRVSKFVWNGLTWTGSQIGPDDVDINAGDRFGESVAVDADKVIVGAPGQDIGGVTTGAVYVFTRAGLPQSLIFRTKLVASDGTASDDFGRALDLEGEGAAFPVIGASGPDAVGVAYGFRPNAPTITSITPTFGSTAGGTLVGIVGTNFDPGVFVEFENLLGTSTLTRAGTSIVTTTPPQAADTVFVRVTNPLGGSTILPDGFEYRAPTATDGDVDGLPDAWETQWGLDPTDPDGSDGGNGNPDNDGASNAEELAAGTHPRGFFTRYLAEGATGPFFDTTLALLNPNQSVAALMLLRYLKSDGTVVAQPGSVSPLSRTTIQVDGLVGLEDAELSVVIEADEPIAVDRTMRWDLSGYGGHSETAILAPATTWYLAEGSTAANFKLFYLLQNATDADASVDVTFLRPAGSPPIVKNYVVAAHSRFNIWVNFADPELASTDVSAQFTSTVPIIVERAMYLDSGGVQFGAGHEAAGVTSPELEWFLAEGATGPYFDLFTLLANVGNTDAQVSIKYLLPDGSLVTKNYVVPANSRFNVWVDLEDPLLANTAVSQTVTSTNGVPIVVERAMWWPGTSATWHEAHASVGATATGTKWATAAGEVGGALTTQTYILIANASAFAGAAKVTIVYEAGGTEDRQFHLNPNSRFNVDVAFEFPASAGQRFGVIVEAVDTGFNLPQLVVEHAMYWNVGGVVWAAGTNHLATALVVP